MKCPKCNSQNTNIVSVIDPNWQIGHQRCKNCNYQDDWLKFTEIKPIKKIVIDSGN